MKQIIILLISMLIFGCSSSKPLFEINEGEIASGTWLVYEGSLPCADCSEIKTRLEILIDYSNPEPPFILKQAYLGSKDEDKTAITHGIYGTLKETYGNNDATVYELNPDKPKETIYFLRVNNDTLKMLNRDRKIITTELNYNLVRTETLKER
jgi:copper homeostasis protein (lipoprotein)